MSENPYEPVMIEQQPTGPRFVKPHSTSIGTEAWRGFRFGAITGAAVAVMAMVVSIAISMFSSGKPPNYAAFLRSVLTAVPVMLAFMTSIGAIIGSTIMALLAFIRRLGNRLARK